MASTYGVYEDFEPSTDWEREDAADTLRIHLPGFKKEQMKVQITSMRNLRISGERQLTDHRWSRFRKEIPISSNYDPNEISAKFADGILYVKQPKIIVPAALKPQELKESSTMEEAAPVPQPQKPTQEMEKPQQEKGQLPQDAPKTPQKPTLQQKLMQPPTEAPNVPETPLQEKEKPRRDASMSERPTIQLQAEASDPKINMDKEKGDKRIDGIESTADNVPPKAPRSMDKERSQYEWKEKSKNEVPDAGKAIITASTTTIKHDDLGASVHDTAKMDKLKAAAMAGIASGIDKFTDNRKKYMQDFSGISGELKKPKKLINLVLVILSLVVLGLYVMNAIRSLKHSHN